MMLTRRQGLIGLAAVLLSACTSLPSRKSLANVLKGRFSLQYVDSTQDQVQGNTGRFSLEFEGERVLWALDAPTGQTLAELEWDELGRTTLRRVDTSTTQTSEHPDVLAQSLFGWPLPVLWLSSRLQKIADFADQYTQGAWQVNVLERFSSSQSLPKRIQIKWLTPQLPIQTLTLTLVFDPV